MKASLMGGLLIGKEKRFQFFTFPILRAPLGALAVSSFPPDFRVLFPCNIRHLGLFCELKCWERSSRGLLTF